ncbi:MAG TPA: MogA/MoaB family molybdenum cofactor biosynthesis protein [Tepidisphaeraceae bacterium]|jgi:molybdenum cofactor biosynthesis protein B
MSYAGHQKAAAGEAPRCAVITLSDTRTAATDDSGNLIRRLIGESGFAVTASALLPDEPAALRDALEDLLARDDVDAILTNGGTGIARRDLTIAVVEQIIDVPLPGFGELFRMLSWEQIGAGAMLSRAVGGVARGRLVFAMPGSPKAVELAMTKLVLPELKHLVHELRR